MIPLLQNLPKSQSSTCQLRPNFQHIRVGDLSSALFLHISEKITVIQIALASCSIQTKLIQCYILKYVIDHKGFLSYTDLSQECKAGLAEESRVAITNRIFQALREVSSFIKENYLPNCRKEYGVGSLPNGKEYYRETLRQVN